MRCVQEARPGAYSRFCEMMHLSKDTYDFTGKKLKLVFSEPYLKVLALCLGEDESCKAMIAYMRATLAVYNICVKRELDPETMIHMQVIDDFKEAFENVHKSSFMVPESLKVHIVSCHLEEYFALTGETLAKCNDEHHENCHGMVRRREENHGQRMENRHFGKLKGQKNLTLIKIINNINKHFDTP